VELDKKEVELVKGGAAEYIPLSSIRNSVSITLLHFYRHSVKLKRACVDAAVRWCWVGEVREGDVAAMCLLESRGSWRVLLEVSLLSLEG
jgi:hypothetical protein